MVLVDLDARFAVVLVDRDVALGAEDVVDKLLVGAEIGGWLSN